MELHSIIKLVFISPKFPEIFSRFLILFKIFQYPPKTCFIMYKIILSTCFVIYSPDTLKSALPSLGPQFFLYSSGSLGRKFSKVKRTKMEVAIPNSEKKAELVNQQNGG